MIECRGPAPRAHEPTPLSLAGWNRQERARNCAQQPRAGAHCCLRSHGPGERGKKGVTPHPSLSTCDLGWGSPQHPAAPRTYRESRLQAQRQCAKTEPERRAPHAAGTGESRGNCAGWLARPERRGSEVAWVGSLRTMETPRRAAVPSGHSLSLPRLVPILPKATHTAQLPPAPLVRAELRLIINPQAPEPLQKLAPHPQRAGSRG